MLGGTPTLTSAAASPARSSTMRPVGDTDLKRLAGSPNGSARRSRRAARAWLLPMSSTQPASLTRHHCHFVSVVRRAGGSAIGPVRTCYGVPMAYQARAALHG